MTREASDSGSAAAIDEAGIVDDEVANTVSVGAASAIWENSTGFDSGSSGPDSWTKTTPATAASTVSAISTVPTCEASSFRAEASAVTSAWSSATTSARSERGSKTRTVYPLRAKR